MDFVEAHTVLGHVTLCKSLPLLHFFPSISKIFGLNIWCGVPPHILLFAWTWKFSSAHTPAPRHTFLKYQQIISTPYGIKAVPTFHKFHCSMNFACQVRIALSGLNSDSSAVSLPVLFFPTCELVSSSFGGFSPSHTP